MCSGFYMPYSYMSCSLNSGKGGGGVIQGSATVEARAPEAGIEHGSRTQKKVSEKWGLRRLCPCVSICHCGLPLENEV